MQFAIIKLTMTMIEQEWAYRGPDGKNDSYLMRFGPIEQMNSAGLDWQASLSHAYRLCSTWHLLNSLKAFY